MAIINLLLVSLHLPYIEDNIEFLTQALHKLSQDQPSEFCLLVFSIGLDVGQIPLADC